MSERTWTVVLVPTQVPDGLSFDDFVTVERVNTPQAKAIETARAQAHDAFGSTDELVPLRCIALIPGAVLIRGTEFPVAVRVDERKKRGEAG